MPIKCKHLQDHLSDQDMTMLAKGIINENQGAGDSIDRQQRLVTTDRSRARLRTRIFAEGNLLECVF